MPDITIHFTGADVNLQPLNAFVLVSKTIACFTFTSVPNFAIYENVAHMNFSVERDTDVQTVSFNAIELDETTANHGKSPSTSSPPPPPGYCFIIIRRNKDGPLSKGSAVRKHLSLLSSVKPSEHNAKDSMVYSYTKSFNAFAAKLSKDEAQKLMELDEVVSVFPNRYHKLHTTKSWDFIGFPQTAKRHLKLERDGSLHSQTASRMMDLVLHPINGKEHATIFEISRDATNFNVDHSCSWTAFIELNSKVVGAKYFKLDGNPDPADILSPVDVDGHGTHTSSTLAGNLVPNASLYGLANGTARGAVPSARIATYKVCWVSSGCADMDILAAMDDAISDGVDVISISIGGATEDFATDSISVGAFHALKKGIITVASGGNEGPSLGSVSNYSPWLLTVAASGINRQFRSAVKLGNGKSLLGIGINTFGSKETFYPIVSGADVAINAESKELARFCYDNTLNPAKVKGRIVYCLLGELGADSIVKGIGGVGIVLESEKYLDTALIFMAPATMVNMTVGETVDKYIHSTGSPSAVIYKSHEVKVSAPFVASFSSRGPNAGSQHVLKPDIAAPGVDILAAYTLMNSLTGLKGDNQHSKFTLMSGTSMAAPHVAGVAAYVKSFHPTWTPAAIKSAIMTTAKPMSPRVNKDAEFAYGAGQLNPTRAINPGLIYDMDEMTYIQFLCHEGYSGPSIAHLIGKKSVNCSSMLPGFGYDALNYPSMQLNMIKGKRKTVGVFTRRVTNVGPPSVYNSTIKAPKGVVITVNPKSLIFTRSLQKRSFKVVVTAKPAASAAFTVLSASLVWKSTGHAVRSPIVIYSLQD
ncbi:Subtilisin-like protease SBT4.14 [Hibiscus syriacus]|uniref:Subtilisin-like protease SBT4.14 n=1 Tax=Hibiscus syriacus TaxID=106335 RepID=A0A6A2ZZT9_HIBSY|nr:Subtilisin-like protease SBT4.14 [Hibiscus syriacus]